MKFSEKLKQAMRQLGINQAQVVGMTGKSKGSVSMYLNDKTVPSEKAQSDIAVSLGLAPDYFEQEEAQKVVKPSKCEDGVETLTVHEVAKVMHKHTNIEIRNALKEKRIPQWKLGEMLGVSENTINRKLRKELPTDEKQKILDIIGNAK